MPSRSTSTQAGSGRPFEASSQLRPPSPAPVTPRPPAGRPPVPAPALALGAADRVLRDHERHVRLQVVDRDRKAERARKSVVLEPLPVLALVVGALDAAVVLLPEAALLL